MHHYSTVAYLTLPRGNEVSHIWQFEIVKLAFANESLLHAILAIAAFHLAYQHLDHRRTYSMIGAQHQSDAARGLRTNLTHLTTETSHGCFASASLLPICAFAALAVNNDDAGRPHPSLEAMIDIFILSRGMNTVLKTCETQIQQGRLADLFNLSTYTTPMVYMEAICGKLHELSLQLMEPQVERATALIVDRAIHILINCIRESIQTAPIPELRVAMTWPIFFSEEYLALLSQKNEMALTVFAYYCAVVHESGSKVWFTKGWGLNVGQDLKKYVSSSWKEAIQWPLDCMSIHGEASAAH
jgi:hypothetical protein